MHTLKTIFLTAVSVFLITSSVADCAGAFAGRSSTVPETVFTNIPVVEKGSPEDIRLTPTRSGGWQDTYSETGMTFIEYITSDVPRPKRNKKTIYLQPMGNVCTTNLNKISNLISAYFTLPVKILPVIKMDKKFYNKQNRKFDGDEILLATRSRLPKDAFAFATLTDKDIFSGRLSAVFGLAYCDLRSCIISTHRTCANPHRIQDRKEVLRVFKLVAHELCHVMGLPHCSAHKCTMNGTMNLNDVNNAPLTLCGPCLKKLQWNLGFDMLKRYKTFSEELACQNLSENNFALNSRINRIEREKHNKRSQLMQDRILAYRSSKRKPNKEYRIRENLNSSPLKRRPKSTILLSAAELKPAGKKRLSSLHKLKNLKKLPPHVLAAARPAELRTAPAQNNKTEKESTMLIASRMEDLW